MEQKVVNTKLTKSVFKFFRLTGEYRYFNEIYHFSEKINGLLLERFS